MGAKNVEKTGFLWFSVKTQGKRLANFLYSPDDAQTHRIAAQLDVKGVPISFGRKKANLIRNKLRFGPKQNVEKTGFLGFSDKTPAQTQKRVAIFLYSPDDAQPHRIAAQLDVKGVPIKKGKSDQKQITF